MGMSASQARFLQLTARRSDVEYQAQQINFQRLQLSQVLSQASSEYNDKMSNRRMVYTFNNGEGRQQVDVTYANYKNFMNQQGDTTNTHAKIYLVSSSGNKLVVGSKEDAQAMIDKSKGTEREFNGDDFMIVEGLDDTDNFQKALKEGIYYFSTLETESETGKSVFKTQGWDTLMAGAVSEELDKTDDAAAEAKFKKQQSEIENKDKKLELTLNELETERDALHTEIESVQKVIDDNVESTFKIFS